MHEIQNPALLESSGYSILFGDAGQLLESYLKTKKFSSVYILTDSNTTRCCLPHLLSGSSELAKATRFEIPAGEEHKNLDTTQSIWSFLMKQNADRKSLLLNLGGGVLTDMGAFAASTYKRGISFLQLPTTLLSQVDASVGGKTGIDFQGQKNMIGTFDQPEAVLIDASFLKTLSRRQLISGAAEMIKHGLISDASFYKELKENLQSYLNTEMPIELIRHSVHLKNEVVLEDPFEKGRRKILNFGHTIGHALESFSLEHEEDPLTHGEAIGLGMVCETYLSFIKAGLSESALSSITSFLMGLYPSRGIVSGRFAPLLKLMQNDKKNEGSLVNFTLLAEIGISVYDHSCTQEEIFKSLEYFNKNLVI